MKREWKMESGKWKIIRAIMVLTTFSILNSPVSAQEPPLDCGTSDERAVCNLNRGLLPPEVNQSVEDVDKGAYKVLKNEPLKSILNILARIFGDRFATFIPTFVDDLAPKAATQQQAELPQELKPEDSDKEKIKIGAFEIEIPLGLLRRGAKNLGAKNIGGDDTVGVYNNNLPQEVFKDAQKTRQFESLFERSYFPPGITPITGQ